MKSRLTRRVAVTAGGGAIIAMVALTAACGSSEEAPEGATTTTTTTTTAPPPPVEPTEKAPRIDPGQPNQFTPPHTAPPAPTATPGRHR